MLEQRTISSIVFAVGVGLHCGKRVEITLRPALPNTGIVFRRIDLQQPVDIVVSALTVTETQMATTIEKDGAKVQTIEHLMSALAGLGIDNIYIDINADEVPILDGSASSFVFLLQQAGIEQQKAAKKFIKVTKEVSVSDGDGMQYKWAKLTPFNGYKLNFEIDFNHPAVNLTGQNTSFDFATGNYVKEVSRARTFGFTKDVEYLRNRGLALGGGLDNAIVLDDYKVLNSTGLRYEDEFSRHKLLDAIGDLYCLGHLLLANYTAFKSGHALNNLLLRELVEQQAFEMVSFTDESTSPIQFIKPFVAWN